VNTRRVGVVLPRRIGVLRALQLGDLLCAVPALRALRAAFPHAHIMLVGLPWAQEFVTRFARYLTGVVEFPGYPGLPERIPQVRAFPRFLSALQEADFDLVLQMHGSGTLTNPLVSLFGARLVAGFYRPGEYCPDEQCFLPYPTAEPEIHCLLRGEAVMRHPPSDASEIEVTCANGAVMLKGTGDNRQMKCRAEEGAESCVGVKEVANL
jgi:ADP-heptose:LPS heptosyltransferase